MSGLIRLAIPLIRRFLGQYWFLLAAMCLLGLIGVQWQLLGTRSREITGLEIQVGVLTSQLGQHQAKAMAMDKLRRAMHKETVTLRDTLKERRTVTNRTVSTIMDSKVSQEEAQSLRWLKESIESLDFGAMR